MLLPHAGAGLFSCAEAGQLKCMARIQVEPSERMLLVVTVASQHPVLTSALFDLLFKQISALPQ